MDSVGLFKTLLLGVINQMNKKDGSWDQTVFRKYKLQISIKYNSMFILV